MERIELKTDNEETLSKNFGESWILIIPETFTAGASMSIEITENATVRSTPINRGMKINVSPEASYVFKLHSVEGMEVEYTFSYEIGNECRLLLEHLSHTLESHYLEIFANEHGFRIGLATRSNIKVARTGTNYHITVSYPIAPRQLTKEFDVEQNTWEYTKIQELQGRISQLLNNSGNVNAMIAKSGLLTEFTDSFVAIH